MYYFIVIYYSNVKKTVKIKDIGNNVKERFFTSLLFPFEKRFISPFGQYPKIVIIKEKKKNPFLSYHASLILSPKRKKFLSRYSKNLDHHENWSRDYCSSEKDYISKTLFNCASRWTSSPKLFESTRNPLLINCKYLADPNVIVPTKCAVFNGYYPALDFINA